MISRGAELFAVSFTRQLTGLILESKTSVQIGAKNL
jgi:hypothetical protein